MMFTPSTPTGKSKLQERKAAEKMDNEVVRRLVWSGLVAGIGALASLVAHRVAAAIWMRLFNEEPPE